MVEHTFDGYRRDELPITTGNESYQIRILVDVIIYIIIESGCTLDRLVGIPCVFSIVISKPTDLEQERS